MEKIKNPIEHIEDMLEELEEKRLDTKKYRPDAIDCAQHYIRELQQRIQKDATYKIYFSKMHLGILRKVFRHCVENKTHIIEKNDIPGLSHTDYGNFYTLRRFGFLYWIMEDGKRVKGGHWGVAVTRIYKFLQGQYTVAEYSEMNTATKEHKTSANRIGIWQIPRYKTIADDTRNFLPYFVEYEQNPDYPEIEDNTF